MVEHTFQDPDHAHFHTKEGPKIVWGTGGGHTLMRSNIIPIALIWVKQCHKPAVTGNALNPTHRNGDLGDRLWHSFTHINHIKAIQS